MLGDRRFYAFVVLPLYILVGLLLAPLSLGIWLLAELVVKPLYADFSEAMIAYFDMFDVLEARAR